MDTAQHVEFAFPITTGFTSTCGFSARSASPPPAAVKHEPVQIEAYGSPRASLTPALNVSPSCAANVGWKALFESSKASSHLGTKIMDVEPDAISPDCHMEICCTAHTTPGVRRLVKSVIRGLRAYQEPEAAVDGMGGTYFFTNDSGRKVAIFKPCDEEPLAPNNPKGYVGRALGDAGWKATVRVGEAAMREVAAYLLDHDHFARVPHTVLARAKHPIFHYSHIKQLQQQTSAAARGYQEAAGGLSASFAGISSSSNILASAASNIPTPAISNSSNIVDCDDEEGLPLKLGSLQEFVRHECDTTEMGCSRFSSRDVQRIAILDIRLFNTDRHSGNILVRKPSSSSSNLRRGLQDAQYELIPIDHGFCLPEALETPYFEWLHWPQASMPLGEEELEYIADLDIQADVQLLQQELPNLRHECLRVLEVSTTLLKKGAAAGLSLMEIATVMTRPLVGLGDEPSELEKLCLDAGVVVDARLAATEQLLGMQLSSSCSSDGGQYIVVDGEEQEEELLAWGGFGGSESSPQAADGSDFCFSNSLQLVPAAAGSQDMLFDIDEAGRGKQTSLPLAGGKPGPHHVAALAGESPMSPYSFASGDSACSLADHGSPSNMHNPILPAAGGIAASAPARHIIGITGNALVWPASSSNGSTMLSPNSQAPDTPTTQRADSITSTELSAAVADLAGSSPTGKQPKLEPAPADPQPSPLARAISLQTDGLPWSSMQLPPKPALGKRSAKSPCKKALQAMYPPPVVSQSVPERITAIFSSYDGVAWGTFMQVLAAKIDEALAAGVWKQATGMRNAAQSCPRF